MTTKPKRLISGRAAIPMGILAVLITTGIDCLTVAPVSAATVQSRIPAVEITQLNPRSSAALGSSVWESLATAGSALKVGEILKAAVVAPEVKQADLDAVAIAIQAAQKPETSAEIQGYLKFHGFETPAAAIRNLLHKEPRDQLSREAFVRDVASVQSALTEAGPRSSLSELKWDLDVLFANSRGKGPVGETSGSAVAAQGLGTSKEIQPLKPHTIEEGPHGHRVEVPVPPASFSGVQSKQKDASNDARSKLKSLEEGTVNDIVGKVDRHFDHSDSAPAMVPVQAAGRQGNPLRRPIPRTGFDEIATEVVKASFKLGERTYDVTFSPSNAAYGDIAYRIEIPVAGFDEAQSVYGQLSAALKKGGVHTNIPDYIEETRYFQDGRTKGVFDERYDNVLTFIFHYGRGEQKSAEALYAILKKEHELKIFPLSGTGSSKD